MATPYDPNEIAPWSQALYDITARIRGERFREEVQCGQVIGLLAEQGTIWVGAVMEMSMEYSIGYPVHEVKIRGERRAAPPENPSIECFVSEYISVEAIESVPDRRAEFFEARLARPWEPWEVPSLSASQVAERESERARQEAVNEQRQRLTSEAIRNMGVPTHMFSTPTHSDDSLRYAYEMASRPEIRGGGRARRTTGTETQAQPEPIWQAHAAGAYGVAHFTMKTLLTRLRKHFDPRRKARLIELKRLREKRKLDRFERQLEDLMYRLPHGYERRQCNNDLLMIRTQRAIKGI